MSEQGEWFEIVTFPKGDGYSFYMTCDPEDKKIEKFPSVKAANRHIVYMKQDYPKEAIPDIIVVKGGTFNIVRWDRERYLDRIFKNRDKWECNFRHTNKGDVCFNDWHLYGNSVDDDIKFYCSNCKENIYKAIIDFIKSREI